MPRKRKSDSKRFWEKVDKDGDCWLWTAACNVGGYGVFQYEGRQQVAHRVAYKMLVGPIGPGLHVDHTCCVRHCVNPAHLEAVTPHVNNRRAPVQSTLNAAKTHCPKGHPYNDANTYITPKGKRQCRECNIERQRDWHDQQRERLGLPPVKRHRFPRKRKYGLTKQKPKSNKAAPRPEDPQLNTRKVPRRPPKPRVPASERKSKTHCPQGHEYTADNVYEYKGKRSCKKCRNERVYAHRRRKRGEN